MELVELVVEVHRHLDAAGISHAFGGALALAYVAEPRGTVDIDVNVFLPPAEMDRVIEALSPLELQRLQQHRPALPAAEIRLERAGDPFPVDVFPALDEARYGEIERRRALHPFGRGGDVLPFLSAEDLCVFKLSFGRPRDWADLGAVAAARPDLDVEYVEEQLVALRGPTMYPRIVRLRSLLRGS